MHEEGEVEVCCVCQEIFLEEAMLKRHMQDSHPEQCKNEGGRAERHSTIVSKLEKRNSLHGPEQALAEDCESFKRLTEHNFLEDDFYVC